MVQKERTPLPFDEDGFLYGKERRYLPGTFDRCHATAERILKESEVAPAIIPILISTRRVSRVYGEETPPLKRKEEVLYDLQCFHPDLGLSLDTLDQGLGEIQRLATAYYPTAEVKLKRLACDTDDNRVAAFNLVDSVVWRSWSPTGESPADWALTLRMQIFGSLRYLANVLYPQRGYRTDALDHSVSLSSVMVQERGRIRLMTDGEVYEITDDFESPAVSAGSPFQEKIESLYSATREMSLAQIFTLIEKMDSRYQKALLKFFGYIYPNTPLYRFATIFGISKPTYRADLRRAVDQFILMKTEDLVNLTSAEGLQERIPQLVLDVKAWRYPTTIYGAIRDGSPRFILITSEGVDDAAFWSRLTDKERQVVSLATTADEDGIYLTQAEIAEALNMNPGSIRNLLSRLRRILETDRERFVNTRGQKIKENCIHHRLICTRRELTRQVQLSVLSPLERELFDFLTVPNEEGRYLDLREAKEEGLIQYKATGSSICQTMLKRLAVTTEQILRLEENLLLASEHSELFNSRQNRAIAGVLSLIQNGEPLGSATRDGLSWTEMERQVGLSRGYAFNFFNIYLPKKIVPLKAKKQV